MCDQFEYLIASHHLGKAIIRRTGVLSWLGAKLLRLPERSVDEEVDVPAWSSGPGRELIHMPVTTLDYLGRLKLGQRAFICRRRADI
jgi:hypothetical protein